MSMDINKAVEIMNKHKWRGWDSWLDVCGGAICEVGSDDFDLLHRDDAIAIASYLSCSECQHNRGE